MGERTRGEGGRGERQKVGRIPSLLSATPWGKKSKRKGGWTLGGWKNHRCDSRQVPIGRPLYIYRYTCIYMPRPGLVVPVASSVPNTSAFRQVLSFPCRCYILSSPDKRTPWPRHSVFFDYDTRVFFFLFKLF